jgi:hypothetical protein
LVKTVIKGKGKETEEEKKPKRANISESSDTERLVPQKLQ